VINASPKKTRMTKSTPLPEAAYTLDDQPGFLLRVALRTHTTFFTAKMIDSLTAPQFSTLAKLKEVGPCSQNYLGRLIHYDSATITGVINRLKTRGLIESIVDPLDRRRVAIDLTETGRQIADEAVTAVREISKDTFSPLSPAEHATLTALLKKVILR
jgi:DNA-binding MarR family transcriptional regulator